MNKKALLKLFMLIILLMPSFQLVKSNSSAIHVKTLQDFDKVREGKQLSFASEKFLDRDFEGYSHFYINATLDTDLKLLYAEMKLEFFNNDNLTFTDFYLHLYPNAYSNEDLIPSDSLSIMYPGGFDEGWIKIEEIRDENGDLNYTLALKDNTILNVSLNTPILPNSTHTFYLKFQEKIPRCQRRFGYYTMNDKTVFSIANWIPIPAVYDKIDGWNLDPFNYIGDPFYSDSAYYDVNITVPSSFIVGATGNLTATIENNGWRTYLWQTTLVRDFAWCGSESYNVKTVNVHGVNVTYLYLEESSAYDYQSEQWSKTILNTFERYFGPYPYEDLTVAETFLAYGGMEYPQLVFIRAFIGQPEVVIAHEIGHQWFYGIIGNDEIDEPFLDEGFASYSEVLFVAAYKGKSRGEEYLANKRNNVNYYYKNGFRGKINQTTTDYAQEDWAYGLLAYSKMAVVIAMLRETLGDEAFKEVLHLYYDTYKHYNAFTVNLIQCVEEVTNSDFHWFFNQWLNYDTLPYYSMELKAFNKTAESTYKITLALTQHTAGFKNLIPIGIVDNNNTITIYRIWLNDTNTREITINYTGKPISVKLDPKECFLMLNDDIEIILPRITQTSQTTSTTSETTEKTGESTFIVTITFAVISVVLSLKLRRKRE